MTHDPLYARLESDFPAQAVLARLGRGKDAARPIGDLQEELGWTRRQVEQAVQSLRLQGFPVCSDGSGIWLGDIADLDATVRSLRGRMVTQYQTYLALRRTLRRMRSVEVKQTSLPWSDAA
jgi:biotin operon repressor